MHPRCLAALVALGTAHIVCGTESTTGVLNTIFPPAIEESLALSGAPEHLRKDATVYVFGSTGFSLQRRGTNGFTCLLNRDAFFYGGQEFKPTCWDAVGADTYVPVMLRVGALLARGSDERAIRRGIASGFTRGEFHAPSKGGVAYMLAGDIDLDVITGEVRRQVFPGHYMFYAVGATNQQLGASREASRGDATLPSVFSEGAGGAHGLGYIIAVPGDAHRHDMPMASPDGTADVDPAVREEAQKLLPEPRRN